MTTATKTPWRLVADEVATCNCAWGCPCQFNALPTTGRCEALVAARIREGHFGNTQMGGVTFAAAYWWPGPIHLGNGIVQLAIDDKATKEQRAALLAICSGKEAGRFSRSSRRSCRRRSTRCSSPSSFRRTKTSASPA